MAVHYRIADPMCKHEDKGMVPGDVGIAGKDLFEFPYMPLIAVFSSPILSYVFSQINLHISNIIYF